MINRFFLLFVFTIFILSCGYKVRSEGSLVFNLTEFRLNDPLFIEYRKDMEWNIVENLKNEGLIVDEEKGCPLIIEIKRIRERTIQSGSDNRQTAKELSFLIKSRFTLKGKAVYFKSVVKIYKKFPVDSTFFIDERKELAEELAQKVSLKVGAWLLNQTF